MIYSIKIVVRIARCIYGDFINIFCQNIVFGKLNSFRGKYSKQIPFPVDTFRKTL